jgi:uncharacterized protein (DUF934 family)
MKVLVRNGAVVADRFVDATGLAEIPASGAVIVSLEQWRAAQDVLIARRDPVGIRLKSDQHPREIAEDLAHFTVIALDFPVFRDGRAYSYARLLRERYGYAGELRAVGDVLLEQLHFMERVGFDAFEIASDDPVADWRTAAGEFTTWYQATGDGRQPARELRHRAQPMRRIA